MAPYVLVAGGGLSGILLSQALEQRGVAHKLVDNNAPDSGTVASSGILNPVMGRRRQVVPYFEKLLPAALQAYGTLETQLGIPLLHPSEITDLFLSAEEALFFESRAAEIPEFLSTKILTGTAQSLDAGWGAGRTERSYTLDLSTLVRHYKKGLQEQGRFIDATFSATDVQTAAGGLRYARETYSHIVLCNGIHTLAHPLFQKLPLSANKGQALIGTLEADLPAHTIYKWGREISLVPLQNGHYWAGASFEWKYEDALPTENYRRSTEQMLHNYLPFPFKVVTQTAGLRTSAIDRRPVAGFHPGNPSWGVLNAMGTKGVLQAPFCAAEMAESIATDKQIDTLHSINRFRRILL